VSCSSSSRRRFNLPVVNNQQYRPVPIVVVGHFDDARARECQDSAQQLCADRLVVTRIAAFDWEGVPTPAPTLPATPFPSPAPSGLFDPRDPNLCAGDVEYSFVGWTTTKDLGLSFERDGHVWAAVTASAVLLGGDSWNLGPDETGPKFRMWGRRICIAEEGKPSVVMYGAVPGTSFKELEDGTHVPVGAP
jgi:hypothetical protein